MALPTPALGTFLDWDVPDWLREPTWWQPLTHVISAFVLDRQGGGVLFGMFCEERGVAVPGRGGVGVIYGGYLTTTGALSYPLAFAAVVSGAVLGSACNLTISRRYGRPFIQRFGRYIGITDERMAWAERIFTRWGPWAIIFGRQIPGMRIALSALSGILGVPYRVFIPCVLISASIWAGIFLEIGRLLGPSVGNLFSLFPAQLFPWLALGLILAAIGYLAYRHGFNPKANHDPIEQPR